MDTQVSKKGIARQNSYPPEAALVCRVQNEPMVDRRTEYPGRSCPCSDPNKAERQHFKGRSDIERQYKPRDPEGVSGIGRVLVGRQLLGGWLFCRVGRSDSSMKR